MRNAVAILVALPWVVWAVVRTFGFSLDYPLVAAVAFTPYVALSSPLPVVVGLALRRWVIAGVAAVAALALALAMVPRALAGPESEARGPRLVVMTSNAYVGRADARAILRIAREHDVDVLSLQELRPELMRRLDRAGALEQFPGRSVDARAGRVRARACCRGARCSRSRRRRTPTATRSPRSCCACRARRRCG